MRTLIVSTWRTPCGIAEHTEMLMDAVRASGFQGPDDVYSVSPELLDPAAPWPFIPDVLHLNYHAALHSRWTPDTIAQVKALGCKVLVTYHDTGVPNSDQCKAVCEEADYFVVHEPVDDLPAHGEYLRMGVPEWTGRWVFDETVTLPRDPLLDPQYPYVCLGRRPVLGSIGFPFPWKCYDELAKVTRACGWGLLLIAPGATADDAKRWQQINPWLGVLPTFTHRSVAISLLAGCDATAFTYVCHNTGQSGAILQGIAARKPVFALETCRQFRALYADPLANKYIRWCSDFTQLAQRLSNVQLGRVDCGIVALAEQESWTKVGARYAQIYRSLV